MPELTRVNDSSYPHQDRTCRASVFLGPGRRMEMREFPVPHPGAREALVRVECCTICGSDVHTFQGARTEPTPSILGHEVVGVVEETGDPPPEDLDGHLLRAGDRVTWSTSVSCGTCDRCRNGLPQKCRILAKYGHERAEGAYALSGGLSEYLLLRPGSATIRVASDLPAEVICPANCATATIAAVFRTAGSTVDRRVLILGAGMLGLTAAAFARSRGASAVTVCDIDPRRLSRAPDFGADSAVEWHSEANELRDRLLLHAGSDVFDLVLELSGSPEAVEAAFRLGDVGARVLLVGSVMNSRLAQFDPECVVRRCLSIQGVHNYGPHDLRTAVAFLERFGSVHPFAELVEFAYPLDEVNLAFERAVRSRPVRVAVRP
jgi:threonine 3-dehydrogenase